MVSQKQECVLLDTEVWLSFVLGDFGFDGLVRNKVEKAASQGELYLSTISLVEVAEFALQKRLLLQGPCDVWLDEAVKASHVQMVSLTAAIATTASQLPGLLAELDTPKRVIVASAYHKGAQLISANPKITDQDSKDFMEIVAVA